MALRITTVLSSKTKSHSVMGTFALGHLYECKGLSFGTVTMGQGSTVLADRQLWPGAEIAPGCQVYGAGAPIRGLRR